MKQRADLAEKLEIIGEIFEIDGMKDLLAKFDKGMDTVKFSAAVIQMTALLIRGNQEAADKVIMLNMGIDRAKVEEMDDAAYTNALKNAILTDVMGFFASSPSTDGQK